MGQFGVWRGLTWLGLCDQIPGRRIKHRVGYELLRTGSGGVGCGRVGAVRAQRGPSPGALVGLGD